MLLWLMVGQDSLVRNQLERVANVKAEGINMALKIYGVVTLSTAANTKSANLIALGPNAFVGKGVLTLAARGSAAGMNLILKCGGVTLIDDQPISYFGATGTLSIKDHIETAQMVTGGIVELYLRNTSGGALTTDISLMFEPVK